MKKVFTTGQVAKICKVAPRTVSKWFDSGRLRGYRIPGSQDRRIPREQLIRFLKEHGYTWDPQSVMSRFARIAGEANKDEIIFFYFEPLRPYTARRASEFSDEGEPTPEQKAILEKVDANAKAAFRVED